MKITCTADLHGFYPQLNGGDLLIVAGDLTAHDRFDEYIQFYAWLDAQDYSKKIVIAGNHDNDLAKEKYEGRSDRFHPTIYLSDTGTEFEGFKIWGTPWTPWFKGIHPKCKAFTGSEGDLTKKWKLIPDDTDILICHSPSWGMHDELATTTESVGSRSLTRWIGNHVNTLKLFVCGHIHEGYGVYDVRKTQDQLGDPRTPVFVNCSHVNEWYRPVNKPVDIEL